MPTLIRLVITLLFLAGLAYGAMFALVAFVEPEQEEVTVRIPSRELLGEPDPLSGTPVGAPPEPLTTTPAPAETETAPPEPLTE